MTILKDTITGETFRVHTCKYCEEKPGIILPEDKYAKRLEDGSWKCGECVITDLRRSMVRVLGPNNLKVREFLQKEQRQVDHWNQFSKIVNHGCTREIMKKEKNRYL